MNKDQIAIYLDEHPEFFNDYPELLAKIKSIDKKDIPLEPMRTLSMTDRILKRAQEDREHLQSSLEWLVEITQANEKIQDSLFNIERLMLTSTNLEQMMRQLREEIATRFDIPHVKVCLVDGADHFIEEELHGRYGGELTDTLRFADQDTVSGWFASGTRPVLRGEVNGDSQFFDAPEVRDTVKSEALIPILVQDTVAGVIAFGSPEPFKFHEGLRTDFLEQMAEKLSIAISNILLMDRLKKQPVIDRQTGLYNQAYLDPVLRREFDLAKRRQKNLSCLKLHIDYFSTLRDTDGENQGETLLQEIGNNLRANSRACDILVRTDVSEFVVLLPEIDRKGAVQFGHRIREALGDMLPDHGEGGAAPAFSIGVASFPGESVRTHKDLLQAAHKGLVGEMDIKQKKTA